MFSTDQSITVDTKTISELEYAEMIKTNREKEDVLLSWIGNEDKWRVKKWLLNGFSATGIGGNDVCVHLWMLR